MEEDVRLDAEEQGLLDAIVSAFPESPRLHEAMTGLFGAQRKLAGVGKLLAAAGVKTEDPLSVGVYVEIQTALENQAHHERTVNLMVMLALNNKMANLTGDVAQVAQAYKAIFDEMMALKAKRESQEG